MFAADKHVLHIGEDNLNLCSVKYTSRSLCVKVGNDTYYANTTTEDVPMNANTHRKLKLLYKDVVYSVYDCGAVGLQCNVNAGMYDIGFEKCVSVSENNTLYKVDDAAWTWSITFSYGTISGTSACLETGNGQSTGVYIDNLQEKGQPVIGKETNGKYCWCKLTNPSESAWVFNIARSSAADCASICARACGNNIKNDANLRKGLYQSALQ